MEGVGGGCLKDKIQNLHKLSYHNTLKILHITASYKPAFIYGGPIYSVSALCEAIQAESLKPKAEGSEKVESIKYKVKSELNSDENYTVTKILQPSVDYGHNTSTIQVYTTLANGKEELPYPNGHTEIIEDVAVTYFKRVTKDHSHFSPVLLLHLWKNAKKFDVVHIHAWWNLVSMGAVIICLLRGVKPIISPRGMLGDYTVSKSKVLFHRFVGRHFLKKCNYHATTAMEADEILKQVFKGKHVEVVDLMEWQGEGSRKSEEGSRKSAVSGPQMEEQSEKLKEGRQKEQDTGQKNSTPPSSERVGVRRIFIIHNLVKLPEKLPIKTRIFDGTLKLIFLSRIHHKKGIELLLEALALVDFPFSLSIVGEGDPGYVESLKRKAEGIKLDGYINWIGAVYGNKKYQLLADHDVFILPSYNENFANVVIEAIAVGTPVLLSEHVGLQDYVKANNFGLVFKLDELKASLEHAYQLFLDEKLVINGSNTINNDFLVSKYLEMYSSVKN